MRPAKAQPVGPQVEAEDAERRELLRAFLTEHRSRCTPADVGLPETGRRRVPGLRRDEVAELIGVTVDWYRRFESGRKVRVSAQLISRVCAALGLDARDQLTLYHLALPEVYQAKRALHRVLEMTARSRCLRKRK